MSGTTSISLKSIAYKTLDFLLFSNIFIALCAVAQAQVTYFLLKADCDKHILGILFFSTLGLYNFSMFMSRPKNPKTSKFRRVRWVEANYRLMITITLIAVLSLLVLIIFLSPASQVLLFFLGVIAISYNLPLFSLGEKRFGLRNVPGLKLFIISLIWSLSCVLLPIVELGSSQSILIAANDTMLLSAQQFLFIAAITIPFDIRDLFQDKYNDLKTLPVIFGKEKSYLICQFLLLGYLTLLLLFTKQINSTFLALGIISIFTAWLIYKSEGSKSEYFCFLFLDGTMILQFVSLLIAGFLL